MAAVLKMLGQTVAPTVVTTLYTVGAGKVGLLKEIIVTNTSSTNTANVKIYAVQTGDSAGVKNIIVNQNIAMGETVGYGLATILPALCVLQTVTDQASVVGITVSGVEM